VPIASPPGNHHGLAGRSGRPADATLRDLGLRLGATIRRLRRERGLTLVQLAELAELSNPFLSQLERGRTRASMESLHRIARALGTTTPGLLAASSGDDSAPRVALTRAGSGRVVTHGLGQTRPLVSGARGMYPVEFVVTSGRYEEFYEHEAAELIYVLGGRLEVDLDADGSQLLGPGDLLYFSGGVRHRSRMRGRRPAQALVVQAGMHPAA
jgi:mannose-6-phosphate isomerase-like protein (cupin superfamily)/DNA-binding XRE family transcriptional regulator